MADKDYLENWRELYSYPNHITSNEYLTEDGSQSLDREEDWAYSQTQVLLKGNAIGTSKNNFLDPIPLFNKLGHIYTNIVNSAFVSARTDAIKVGIRNMDFTNGRTLEDLSPETVEVYEFFNFYGYTEMTLENIYNRSTTQANTNGNAIATLLNRIDKLTIAKDDDEGFSRCCIVDEDFLKSTLRLKQGEKVTVVEDLDRYTNWFENYIDKELFYKVLSEYNSKKPAWEQFWIKIDYVYTVDSIEYTQHYYAPSLQYVISWIKHCEALNGTQKGLQLLMPQYKRRVEVEDLDKNFWVISQILDAVVNALWGPYGLIDVVRQLVLKVLQIEDFLGLDNLTDIELLHSGSNDMYFDMYSRFTLSGLELKLKTSNGERIIKNIFKAHTETSDRVKSTTDGYNTREELFLGIQTNEITPVTENLKFTGLYDSDIITSAEEVTSLEGDKNIGYTSVSAVIDAINNAIVQNSVGFGSYEYANDSKNKEFFSKLDSITPDGTLSPSDLKQLTEDVMKDYSTIDNLTLKRLEGYQKARDFLMQFYDKETEKFNESVKIGNITYNLPDNIELKNKEDIDKYFVKKKGILNVPMNSVDIDQDGNIEKQEWLNYANEQLEEIREILNYYLSVADNDGLLNKKLFNNDSSIFKILHEQYNNLKNYFYWTEKKENSKSNIYINILDSQISTSTVDTYFVYGKKSFKRLRECGNENIENLFSSQDTSSAYVKISTEEQNTILEVIEDKLLDFERKIQDGLTPDDFTPDEIEGCMSYNRRRLEQLKKLLSIENYNFRVDDFDGIGLLPSEDIYVYHTNVATIIAQYLASKSTEKTNFKDLVGVFNVNKNKILTYFDIGKNGDIDVRDAAAILRYMQNESNASYNKMIKDLKTELENNGNVKSLFENILIAYYTGCGKDYSTQGLSINDIKSALFIKKKDGSNTITKLTEFYTPTLYLIIALQKMAGVGRIVDGYEITNADRQSLINSISEIDYKLYGNILIFLYDEDYYKLKFYSNNVSDKTGTLETKIDERDGLYVKAVDGFYTTQQPLIRYNRFLEEDNTYALFVPRSDLINGEIIQLRLTERSSAQRQIEKKMINFNDKNVTEKGFTKWTEGTSKIFLSLHNCFSTKESQYNHRTTLFFDNIVPEKVIESNGNRPFTKVDDWFVNGIEYQYFRPKNIKKGQDTSTAIFQHKAGELKIRASMLSKNEPYNDNSFVFEDGDYSNPTGIDDKFYSFSRKQAYCAAQRHNLLFYSSAATAEDDMFIHSPLQLLQTPYTRTDDSIQSPSWAGPPNEYKSAHDVMHSKGDNCTIADIKNMLYKNSLADECRPHCIEAVWGSRKVDDYVKKKKLQYIIIEREPGSRNSTYGPTSVGVSYGYGYLHDKNGITSHGEFAHGNKDTIVQWYKKTGELINYVQPIEGKDSYFPPADAQYGVIDLTNVTTEFANAFLIRFYAGDPKHIYTGEGSQWSLNKEFTFTHNEKTLARRPIFRMAYFFGIDETGKKKEGSTGSSEQYK